MSQFDKEDELFKKHHEQLIRELIKNVCVGELLVCPNVQIVWIENNEDFHKLFEPCIQATDSKSIAKQFLNHKLVAIYTIAPNDNPYTTPPILQNQEGRPFIELDCSKLCKGDALGSLNTLSQLSYEKKPLVAITNITEIPKGGPQIDDPEYVEELLLHEWKEEIRQLSDKGNSPFTIRPQDYTIIIPILETQKNNINLTRLRTNGFSQVHLKEALTKWGEAFNDAEQLSFYKKIGWISDVNERILTVN